MGYVSKWDKDRVYQIPMQIFRAADEEFAGRRNGPRILLVLAFVCRYWGRTPDESFCLDCREVGAQLGMGRTTAWTILKALRLGNFIEHHPDYVPGLKDDGSGERKPVIWCFTAWVASALRYMLRPKDQRKDPPQTPKPCPDKYTDGSSSVVQDGAPNPGVVEDKVLYPEPKRVSLYLSDQISEAARRVAQAQLAAWSESPPTVPAPERGRMTLKPQGPPRERG